MCEPKKIQIHDLTSYLSRHHVEMIQARIKQRKSISCIVVTFSTLCKVVIITEHLMWYVLCCVQAEQKAFKF